MVLHNIADEEWCSDLQRSSGHFKIIDRLIKIFDRLMGLRAATPLASTPSPHTAKLFTNRCSRLPSSACRAAQSSVPAVLLSGGGELIYCRPILAWFSYPFGTRLQRQVCFAHKQSSIQPAPKIKPHSLA